MSLLPNDPDYVAEQGDLDHIHAPDAWDVTVGSESVVIGVVDSGMQLDHADLAANLFVNPNETAGNQIDDDGNGLIDDVHGWDFYANDNDPVDVYGHGTSMAGITGAVGNNATGGTGMTWNSKLLPLRTGDGIIFGQRRYKRLIMRFR